MSSKLFAFQVAKPIESSNEELDVTLYDPQTQMSVWQGGARPLAVYCTRNVYTGYVHCNAYGNYCNGWNPIQYGYNCD